MYVQYIMMDQSYYMHPTHFDIASNAFTNTVIPAPVKMAGFFEFPNSKSESCLAVETFLSPPRRLARLWTSEKFY